ncbi:hypothetical protein QO000_000483 [Alkalihalobacillus hemicentroti]|uniref:Uncharacterized protein n=1 Tax=Guptibacillus hwajinpoensis TaxID=208199 RepID=A0ABU0JWT0_9BACL|nr:hypothetical protein [Alkalihalobacillus hemicentroti]
MDNLMISLGKRIGKGSLSYPFAETGTTEIGLVLGNTKFFNIYFYKQEFLYVNFSVKR